LIPDLEFMESTPESNILQRRVGVPHHVVFRDFVSETVLLNIETGQYHGLNPVAGRMLTVLDSVGSVEAAAQQLAKEFEQPLERIAEDLSGLCEGLLHRNLLEIRDA
jgi:Coenzyme PQQ synthesis protein D (PqqD)